MLTVLGSDHGLVVAGINGRRMKKGTQGELREGPALFFLYNKPVFLALTTSLGPALIYPKAMPPIT